MLRVVRTAALAATDPGAAALAEGAEWFMDYRNADGSVSEMCGNGVRVFALHLLAEGLVEAGTPIPVGTRDGVKVVTPAGGAPEDGLTADMGAPRLVGRTEVSVGERAWPARHVDMGNPHAVAFVDSLDDAGALLEAPGHDAGVYPDGRQRRVRGAPRPAARRDAGPRARLGRDRLVRHRRLRGDGRRGRGRRGRSRPAGAAGGVPGGPAGRHPHHRPRRAPATC